NLLQMLAGLEAVPMSVQTPDGLRQAYGAFSSFGSSEDMASVVDRTFPGPAGDLPIRIYVPHEVAGDRDGVGAPGLIYLHGGGWVIGNLETHDTTVRALAQAAGVVAISVDYRLAPESPFPAAIDDALAAVRWVVDNAAELGVDPSRLAIGGDSAGGNLTAVVCQRLRDTGPEIRFQLLVYPATDLRMGFPSIDENAEGYFLTKEAMEWFSHHYLGDHDPADPLVSPFCAPDAALSGLPPGLTITAEFDPLRDEGEAYAQRLRAAGVDMTATRYDGVIHGFFSMRDMVPDGGTAIDEAGAALRSALK
ncbi:MAG TPA: alpha/beta hydrolase, partial [Acidimicrobiales bacterium]